MPNQREIQNWIAAVLQRYESPLLRYALRLTGDRERAREIVQDTFLELCREGRGEVEDYLAQWLFTVCRNRSLNVLRQERHRKPLMQEIPDGGASPAQEAEYFEAVERIFQALPGLPENQRVVLVLKFKNDLSYREISERTGLTITNVGYLIHVALRALRARLKEASPIDRRGGQT